MKSSRVFLLSLSCVLLSTIVPTQVSAMPPGACNPGYIDDAPPRIRKICVALSTLYELGSAMENYVNDKVPVMHDGNLLMENGVKRQDADHVFLRFGRSSGNEPNPESKTKPELFQKEHHFLRIGRDQEPLMAMSNNPYHRFFPQ